MGMTETVRRRAASAVVLILRSARSEEIPQNRNKRARVSKDEYGALMLRDGGHSALKTRVRALRRLLSMRDITVLGMRRKARRVAKRVSDHGRGRFYKDSVRAMY